MADREQASLYGSIVNQYLFLYQITGIMPLVSSQGESAIRKALKKFLPKNCLVGVVVYSLMGASYAVRMIQERILDVDQITEFIVMQGLSLRYFLFYLKRRELGRLLSYCQELWCQFVQSDEPSVMIKYTKIANYFKLFFIWSSTMADVLYFVTAMTVRLPPLESNGTERRILFFRMYFDVQEEPLYSLTMVVEIIAVTYTSTAVIAYETVCPLLIMMSCGYMRILRNRLHGMSRQDDDANENGARERVRDCVKFHRKTLIFCKKIQNFSTMIMMVQISASIYNCALIGFVMLSKNPSYLKQVALLFLTTLQFFACNWIPEILINESEAVANAAYSTCLVFRSFNKETHRLLLMMMTRAQSPVQLTAGGYIRLSLESFKQMTMSALSFFTVLRSVQTE